MRRDTCRSCRGPIIWASTEAGKSMPVDPEPHEDGNVLLHRGGPVPTAVVLGPIEIHERRERDAKFARHWESQPRLYRSHFVDCPQAERWRAS